MTTKKKRKVTMWSMADIRRAFIFIYPLDMEASRLYPLFREALERQLKHISSQRKTK
jgi:hypothetical protein